MANSTSIPWPAAALVFAALLACGEDLPPGAASPVASAMPPPSGEAVPKASEAESAAPSVASVDASPPPPAAGPSTDAGAPPTVANTVAKASGGNIMGTVTTTPAKSARWVVVYLKNGPPAPSDKPPTAAIDQRKMTFSPFVTAIPVGGKVIFRNDDPFPHNVFSPDNEKFDLGTMSQNSARVHVFKNPGAYSLLCNIHPNMLAYIEVVPSSYYAKTDKDGKYTIKNVPPGSYELDAWGPKLAPISQPVTVASGDVTANLELHRGR